MDLPDLYNVLSISPESRPEEIKKAYKKLALKYHPDKNSGNQEAEEMFKAVNQAYQILGNPTKKAQYDQLKKEQDTPPPPSQRTSATYRQTYRPPTTAPKEPAFTGKKSVMMVLASIFTLVAISSGITFLTKDLGNRHRAEEIILAAQKEIAHGNWEEIRILADQALIDYPLAKAYFLAAQARLKLNEDLEMARSQIKLGVIALQEEEKDVPPGYYVLLGDINASQAYYKEAEDSYFKAKERGLKELTFLLKISELHTYKSQEFDKAFTYLDQIIKLYPNNAQAYLDKAICLLKLDRLEESYQNLRLAAQLNPNNPLTDFYYAQILLHDEAQRTNACEILRKVEAAGIPEAQRLIKIHCP